MNQVGEEKWFAVNPKTDCPHAKTESIKRMNVSELQKLASLGKHDVRSTYRITKAAHPHHKNIKAQSNHCQSQSCSTFDSENWICLCCHFIGCSRYMSSHLLEHHTESTHPIAASFVDLSVYCYSCDDYIVARESVPALDALHWGKFGEQHPLAKNLLQPAVSSSSETPLELLTQELVDQIKKKKKILKDGTIESFAEFLKENKCQNIIVLTGAGTPGTGLYDNLQKYNLPTPQSVFDIQYFLVNPKPFFLLAKELYPGNFRPTESHYFIKMLDSKGVLLRNFTQNIDTLERVAGIDDCRLVEAHGSFGAASCVGHFQDPAEDVANEETTSTPTQTPPTQVFQRGAFIPSCSRKFTQLWVKEKVFANQIPRCPSCNGLVKPNITFFGEPLPQRFHKCLDDFDEADALIVMGSSLKVSPFAHLPQFVGGKVPRLLINNELVGDFDLEGESGRDAMFLGSCDDGVRKLAELMGWGVDFEELIVKEGRHLDGEKYEEEVGEGGKDDGEAVLVESLAGLGV
ncbi:UNVERIFIED_CONTAM: NAD-dependent protein deacetylase sirtuin-2 [Siphonaria sp. JEL0065]|nr:NAD-dependent protein deacetylase sirtuin-2 [Siphonaria sp. JEL0065]